MDGAIPSVTIILRTIFAANILVNGGLYIRLSNPLSKRASFFDDVPVVFKNTCRSHACKTILVRRAVPTLINANQSFST